MPLAYLLALGGAVLLVAGWTDRNLLDVLLGRDETLPDSSPDEAAGSFGPGDTAIQGAGQLGDILLDTADMVGLRNFDGHRVAGWIVPYLTWARAHGWTGKVTSGFRTRAEQQRIWNSGVRPAAKPGTSNHEGSVYPRGAVDVTNAAQLAAVLARKPGPHLLVWAGAKDPVHFSHPHNGSY